MILRLLYSFALFLLIFRYGFRLFNAKYRETLKERLGINLPPRKESGPLIWLHAVSMGETKGAAAFAKLLKEKYPRYTLLISSVTATGHEEAKKSMPFADYFIYMPFDFKWCVRRVLDRFTPHMVILTETDLWLHFLEESKRRGAKIAVINAKVSERSARRWEWFKSFAKQLYSLPDLFCAQSEEYAERLKKLGVSADKIFITGNIKLDTKRNAAPECINPNRDKLIVIASSHNKEEELLIPPLLELCKRDPEVKIAIAPRHPERFDKVYEYLLTLGFPIDRFSQSQKPTNQVLLIDAMGQLSHFFKKARVSIVAGSFIPDIGGHNVVEPCLEGSPVLFGPWIYGQKELAELVLYWHAGKQIAIEDLKESVKIWLYDDEAFRQTQKNCYKLLKACSGTIERTFSAIQPWLD